MTSSPLCPGMTVDDLSLQVGTGNIISATANMAPRLLFVLRSANMQSTSDQAFSKIGTFTNYAVTNVYANQKTGGASVTCAGGIYTGAAKSGDALIAAVQSWVTLAAGKIVNATLAAVAGTNLETATPILSLTTGSTAAITADVFIFGVIID